MSDVPAFAELAAATNFSFLHGASHPSDMVGRALELKHKGIGIADRNTVAGVVRAYVALKEAREKAIAEGLGDIDFKLIVGARFVFADGTPDIIAYPETRKGWGRLCRLLTIGNLRTKKGECTLYFSDLLDHLDELSLIVVPPAELQGTRKEAPPSAGLRLVSAEPEGPLDYELSRLRHAAPGRVWLGATMHRAGRDHRRLAMLKAIAARHRVPLIAINDALYAKAGARPLQDILTCIREKVTIHHAGRRLAANAERHLKAPAEMLRLFRDAPEAIAQTQVLLDRIEFSLDQLTYEYPHEPVPEGWDPQSWLEHLVEEKGRKKFGGPIPSAMRKLLDEEFALIRSKRYAYYFLTVHDVVAYARSKGILCQGRGSAANSAVCYLLEITSVDPVEHNLLFSRFVSEERNEPPDIDVDFEHERREEVMQYIYDRYGRHRAGIAATVIHYRPRSAVREVGKALGLTEDVTQHLASTVWGSYASGLEEERFRDGGLDLDNPEVARLHDFVGQILTFPRHLSQHVGGFVLSEDRLDETVPILNAAMEERTFIEWDKDDIDALGLMKVDVLALGMLTCIRKAFALIEQHEGTSYALDTVPDEQEDVYEMLQKGDSIGVFQVESRAQMNMLPRLKPEKFYDLVIQVAIVRPGPIQGNMVHPYLRRRAGEEAAEYPSPGWPHSPDELRDLLGKTEGVPLFQEQAMKLAIVAADFTSSEANELRRAMATFRNVGKMDLLKEKMVKGMTGRGYAKEFAERCYRQIEGFGSYGFPESHALSFARLVYISAYIKCRYPAIFAAALLNSQPMGFYAPAQIVRDAREHDVEVRPTDINASGWDNSLERRDDGTLALRLGFHQVEGFREDWADTIVAARASGAFADVEELARRCGLPRRALRLLADADACRSIGLERRAALWEVRRIPGDSLPLFAVAQARELGEEAATSLPAMPLSEHVATDYQMTRLSLKGHPMQFLRDLFAREGVLSCADLAHVKDGTRVKVAGVVLVRQRPGTGNAIFVTLEDETGIANALLWARLLDRYRRAVMASRLMLVEGEVQKSESVIHVMASRIIDRSAELARLSEVPVAEGDPSQPNGMISSQHPRNVRIMPKSRDFH